MSERKCCCQKPEQLEGKAEECSSQKIRECHGDNVEQHPCEVDQTAEDNA